MQYKYPSVFQALNSFLYVLFSVSSVMSLSASGLYKGYDRAFCVRMKSTLTKRGCHFKSSGYRVSESRLTLTKSRFAYFFVLIGAQFLRKIILHSL